MKILLLFFVCLNVYAADNTIYIDQVGNNNQITITQTGSPNNVGGVSQQAAPLNGDANQISVTQDSSNQFKMEITGDEEVNKNYNENVNENDIPVNSTDINNLNRSPQVFKTIDVVRNRLFAANAITTYFDLTDEFDSRAYRFDSSRLCNLYNLGDTYTFPSVAINANINEIKIEGAAPVVPINYN
jgi:hypothetical protein